MCVYIYDIYIYDIYIYDIYIYIYIYIYIHTHTHKPRQTAQGCAKAGARSTRLDLLPVSDNIAMVMKVKQIWMYI